MLLGAIIGLGVDMIFVRFYWLIVYYNGSNKFICKKRVGKCDFMFGAEKYFVNS